MEGLLFGPAGVPRSTIIQSTRAGVERVWELGLGCMEVEFVQGVRMKQKDAYMVREVAQMRGIRLTAHAPYFINLNAQEEEKLAASKERIIHTARIASLFGGEGVVFHPAFYLNQPRAKVYETVKRHLEEIIYTLRAQGNKLWLRPEVMGKESQFGTPEELLRLSVEVEGVMPCVDFAHWHARTGQSNSYEEFLHILDQIGNRLGRRGWDNMLIHVSGIDYGKQGERKHLNLKDSDFNYIELLRALKAREVKGIIISESPNRELDALLMKQTYDAM